MANAAIASSSSSEEPSVSRAPPAPSTMTGLPYPWRRGLWKAAVGSKLRCQTSGWLGKSPMKMEVS